MTLPPCQQLLPHGQFLHGQPLRSQPSVPARPTPGAPLPEQPQQPRSYPRSFPPQLAAQLAAPLDPSSGAQVIEGCMKKLKDLNKPFKYIGAPAYLREG